MLKGGTPKSALTTPHGVNVGNNEYGAVVTYVVGTAPVKPRLVWYNGWIKTPIPTNPAQWMVVGTLGAGGKKADKSSSSAYYSAALDLLHGLAPIRTILNGWYNNQKLGVVRCSASGFISNGQFTFTPTGGNSTATYTGSVPTSGTYQVTVPNFVSDLNEVTANGVSLNPAAYPPGAGQYSVDTVGHYNFNVAQAGAAIVINYRAVVSGTAAVLAAIIGVEVAEPYSATFNDFGASEEVTYYGTWHRPLWNSRWPVPARLDIGAYTARMPYCWWWDGLGAGTTESHTIYFPAELEGKPVTVHFAVPAIYKSDGTFATSTDTCLELLNLEAEVQFASGSEYALFPGQRQQQNWVYGLGSVRFDLGTGNSMPNLSFETVGMFALWPSGDADPADAIADLLASGPVMVAPMETNPFPASAQETGTGTGTVAGTITDASTGSPISGATVSFTGGSTTTAADGSFSFSSVTPGTYTFTISASGYTTATRSVTVYGSSTTTEVDVALSPTSGGGGGGTSPGTGWTTVSNLQAMPGWIQPSNAGNTGGKSSQAHGTYTLTGPNGDGSYTFAIQPASPYDNYFLYLPVSPHPKQAPQSFRYDMQFMYPVGNLSKSMAYEFQLQFSDGHYTYNMAWQADIGGSGNWRYFHYIGQPGGWWIDTGIPVSITEGVPVVVSAYFDLNSTAGTTTHVKLVVDGKTYDIGVTQAAIAKNQSNYLDAAIQLDSKRTYPAYEVQYKASLAWLP